VKLALIAVGRLKSGPERDLVERYRARIVAGARTLGFGAFEIVEIPESRARREADRRLEEAKAILDKAGTARLVLLDERGRSRTSPDFATTLAGWRDDGVASTAFVIGGPDGLDPGLTGNASLQIGFGTLTLPHQLVRVLIAEQIYRALTIIGGHPYHRAGHDG
jgi:23S rRNA (pseudouridine1915-N3)-methyltransferase